MHKIEEQLKLIANADKGQKRKNITVIGSGMAGLSAAYELKKLGHSVSILEATNRVGGRVWTHRFDSDEYHELGAMRIPASHDFTRHYIGVSGLDGHLRPFITGHRNKNCFYYFRGKTPCRIKDAHHSVLGEYRLSTHERDVASRLVVPAILGLHFENTLKTLTDEDRESMFGGRFFTDRVAELERQSLGEYFERRLGSVDARELIGAATGIEVWWEKAVSQFLRDEIVDTGTGLEEIAGGMDQLPNKLADEIGREHIRFNTAVMAIELRDQGVLLRTRPTDETKWDSPLAEAPYAEDNADFVICTIPFGVLRRMDITGLSAMKMRAIRNLSYASSTKVLLHCKERFWELGAADERIIGGASFSDQITRATYYPSDHARSRPEGFARQTGREGFGSIFSTFTMEAEGVDMMANLADGPGPGVLVGSYNWGPDAQRLGSVPRVERGEVVMKVIENFHPMIRNYVDGVESMSWDSFPWSAGAFCFMQPGDLRDYYHDAIRPEGGLYFAGEHCSLDQGWMQGAIAAGLRAVEEIVGSQMRG